jgi:hypothetical protein
VPSWKIVMGDRIDVQELGMKLGPELRLEVGQVWNGT